MTVAEMTVPAATLQPRMQRWLRLGRPVQALALAGWMQPA